MTTRTLMLLRHARAVPAEAGMRDYDRPLDRQGEADAAALGRIVERRGIAPERIVCSGSLRTRRTLLGVFPGAAGRTLFDDSLYAGGEEAYAALAEGSGTVVLVGHNPMIETFARRLAGTDETEAGRRLARGFPKGGLAIFSLGDGESTRLVELLAPPFP